MKNIKELLIKKYQTIKFNTGRNLEKVESYNWFTSESLKRSIYNNQVN